MHATFHAHLTLFDSIILLKFGYRHKKLLSTELSPSLLAGADNIWTEEG
jgi:hypothetical protein